MKKFDIYTKPGCPFCERAKDLLKERGHQYNEHQLSISLTKGDVQKRLDLLGESVQVQTVPQIFLINDGVKDTYIGGYTELRRKIDSI